MAKCHNKIFQSRVQKSANKERKKYSRFEKLGQKLDAKLASEFCIKCLSMNRYRDLQWGCIYCKYIQIN